MMKFFKKIKLNINKLHFKQHCNSEQLDLLMQTNNFMAKKFIYQYYYNYLRLIYLLVLYHVENYLCSAYDYS